MKLGRSQGRDLPSPPPKGSRKWWFSCRSMKVWQLPAQGRERKTYKCICLSLLPLGVSKVGPLQVMANMGGNPGAICSEAGCMVQEILPSPQGKSTQSTSGKELVRSSSAIPLFLNLEPFLQLFRVVMPTEYSL